MFRRRRREATDSRKPRELYDSLRARALDLDVAAAGLTATAELPRVYGAMLETGIDRDVATLLSLSDGTTSLYTTSGFAIIGGGAHPQVVAATTKFLIAIEGALDNLDPDSGASLPSDGETIIRALTYDGRRSVRAPEDDFVSGRHRLSALLYSGHDVITELRLIESSRPR